MASLKENAITKISTTDIDFSGVGQTNLYTVPTGKVFIPIMAVVRPGADAGATIVTFGRVGSLTDFLGAQNLGNLNAAGDMGILQPIPNATPVLLKTYAAGVVFQIDVTAALGGVNNDVDLFGFIVDA